MFSLVWFVDDFWGVVCAAPLSTLMPTAAVPSEVTLPAVRPVVPTVTLVSTWTPVAATVASRTLKDSVLHLGDVPGFIEEQVDTFDAFKRRCSNPAFYEKVDEFAGTTLISGDAQVLATVLVKYEDITQAKLVYDITYESSGMASASRTMHFEDLSIGDGGLLGLIQENNNDNDTYPYSVYIRWRYGVIVAQVVWLGDYYNRDDLITIAYLVQRKLERDLFK